MFLGSNFLRSNTVYLVTLLTIFSCAKSKNHEPEPPPPCNIGVNKGICSQDILERSAWKFDFSVSSGPSSSPQEKSSSVSSSNEAQSSNKSKKNISVFYEFSLDFEGPIWRRTMIVDSENNDRKSMIQGGTVLGISSDKIEMEMRYTSCAGDSYLEKSPKKIDLYYLRVGPNLKFDTKPIPVTSYSPMQILSGAFVFDIIGKVTVSWVEQIFKHIFSFGSARIFLEDGHIDLYQSENIKKAQFGEQGCFSSMGSGFSPYKQPSSN